MVPVYRCSIQIYKQNPRFWFTNSHGADLVLGTVLGPEEPDGATGVMNRSSRENKYRASSVARTGIGPATLALLAPRSGQLSYPASPSSVFFPLTEIYKTPNKIKSALASFCEPSPHAHPGGRGRSELRRCERRLQADPPGPRGGIPAALRWLLGTGTPFCVLPEIAAASLRVLLGWTPAPLPCTPPSPLARRRPREPG